MQILYRFFSTRASGAKLHNTENARNILRFFILFQENDSDDESESEDEDEEDEDGKNEKGRIVFKYEKFKFQDNIF